MSDCSFLSRVLSIHKGCVRTALFGCYLAGATLNCCHLGAVCLNYTTMSRHYCCHLGAVCLNYTTMSRHYCCHLGAVCLNYTTMSRHFVQISHIGRVQACSAVTCYLLIRQNDRYLLRATAHTVNSVKEIKSFQRRTICRLGVKVSLGRRRENTNVQRKNRKTVAFFDGMKETERMESG